MNKLLDLLNNGFEAVKVVSNWFKNHKAKKKAEEKFDAQHKTKSYLDKYHSDD